MLGGIAFSVSMYEWLKCAFVRHSFLIVEGSIDKMKNIYPLNSRFTLPFAFVLAVSLLAVSLMFMLPGGLLHAQTGPIEYPENGTGAVATFTAIDPEGESIVWSLDAGNDMGDFSIENGVLRFKSPPDFESPQGGGTGNASNTYTVTVQASDGGMDTTAAKEVTIEVTNVEEDGTVMLSTLQPQVGKAIIATLTDPDIINTTDQGAVTWQWYRGNTPIAGATVATVTDGAPTSTYTPIAGDIGSVLSAKAMYDDDEGDDKTAEQDSAHASREAPTSNVPPTFPMLVGGTATNQTREISENTLAGTNIGDPVTASDTDVLTYSLEDDADASSFDINRATGHLITKAPLDYEDSGNSDHLFIVNVTATDPFGALTMAQVTIMVTDVNEAPELAGVVSIDLAENITGLNDSDTSVTEGQFTVTDEDEDDNVSDDADIKWLLSGADSSKFQLTTTGATRTLSFEAMPNFESPGDSDGNNVYEVTVMVTDTKGNTDEQAVMVKVTNVEEPGAIDFSTLQPRVGFPVTATLTDPDNVNEDSLEWQWYRGTNINTSSLPPSECEGNVETCLIKGATSAVYVPVADDADPDRRTLTAVAMYTDGSANEDDAKDVVAEEADYATLVATANQAPVFPDQDDEMEGRQTAQERSIAENSPATNIDNNNDPTPIGAAVAAEPDEDSNLTYSLGGPDAGSFALARDTGQLQVKAALDKETKDTYTVTVTATDSLGASSTITVTIKVTNVDEMPDLEGEAPEEYAENGTAAVATFTAIDPEGESIVWSLAAGGDMEDFAIENGVLRFKSSPDFESRGSSTNSNTYEVTVQASDGGRGTTATEVVTIEVTNVDEDGTVTLSNLQPQVDVMIMATLDDPDEEDTNTITWQWYRSGSPISGANTDVNTATSTYIPASGDIGSTLRAEAMYDDGEDEDKTARGESFRSVRSAPAGNTAPVFPDQDLNLDGVQEDQDREVAENTRAGRNIGAPVAANDTGDLLTYSLDATGATSFDIVRSSGQIKTKAALNFEATPTFKVTVTATDPFRTSDTSEVTITVTDVNEDPMFTAGATSIDHEEGTTVLDVDASNTTADPATYTIEDEDNVQIDDAANLRWTLSGADVDKFDISTTGGATRTLSFKDAPDFESPGDSGRDNVYQVTVKVTDSESNTAERAVTVKVINIEEDGTVELSTLQPRIGFPLTATLTDTDNITPGSVSWQWYKGSVASQADLERLDVLECDDGTNENNCFIKGATSATYRPGMNDSQNTLVAVALYTDGSLNDPADAKDFAMMVTANQVLADTRNKAPVFPDQDDEMDGEQTDQERSIVEATALVRTIGDPVIAMDFITVNIGTQTEEVLTYSLGGPDAASFSIDRETAQLSTKTALDYETKNTYTVTVTATDPSGETATVTVTIKVTDDDEAPIIMIGGLAISGMRNVEYAENGTGAVGTYVVAGPDAASAMWTLEGDDAGDFNISSGGVLNFNNSPDYDMPADADNNNIYMVTVKADDGTYMDTYEVTVTVVADAEEVPTTISSGPSDPNYAENDTRVVATYKLAGTNAALATWSLEGTDADVFDISNVGVLTFRSPPDYEMSAAADTDNIYMIIVKATDGTYTDSLDVTVTVTDVDEVPTIEGDATIDYAENGTDDVATYTAMDPEGAMITWSLAGTDAGVFDISNGGVLTFKSSPDYEMPANADNTYMVTVKASAGADMDSLDVTVTVTDVDEELTSISGPSNTDYAENGTDDVATYTAMDPEGAMITWSLAGTDAGVFDISNGGVLTFKSSPDYEMPANADNTYMVTVKASAGADMDSLDVTVTVTDVDEELTSISGPSNTDYAENRTDDVATFIAMDPEGATISWTLEGTDAGDFDISSDGVLTFGSSPDYETPADANTDNIYMVTVNASDGTNMATTLAVTITVTDVDETPLEISGMSQPMYAENGTGPVATYMLSGANAASAVWTLEGPDAGDFTISGGVLVFRSSPDYETKTTYMITVNASAGADMDTLEVTVTVTDVSEMAPEMSLLEMYDENDNNRIDKDEALVAINDYLFGVGDEQITKDQVLEVITLYLFG